MSTRRRVKNIDYDDDDYCDSFDDTSDEDASGDEYRPRVAPVIEKKKKIAIKLAEPKPPPTVPTVWEGVKHRTNLPPLEVNSKAPVNLVVVGHVDAGKSTLVGHLLLKVKAVSENVIAKFRAQSASAGKASFAFAWILDEGEDERERGVTIDVCVKYFETFHKIFTIFDAPGHQDFVPNMIFGAMQAEAALLVIDGADFETGFGPNGRIKEHSTLVRALGIEYMVVAVNKMDAINWSQERYQYIVEKMTEFLCAPSPLSWRKENVQFVPISAYQGVNLSADDAPLPDLLGEWWVGRSLLGALDGLPVHRELARTEEKPLPPRAFKPMKALVVDSFVSGQMPHVSLKVTSGTIRQQDTVLILPSLKEAVVKHMTLRGKVVPGAAAGDYVEEVQLSTEIANVHVGSALVGPGKCPKVGNQILVQLLVLDISLPICKGQQLMCHVHAIRLPATVLAVEKALNRKTGVRLANTPKALKVGDIAVVRFSFKQKIVYDIKEGSGPDPFTRVVLRERGKTLAAGYIIAEN